MRSTRILIVAGLVSALGLGCGGEASEPEEQQQTSGNENTRRATPPPDDGVAIEGIMGTISADEVQMAMDPRMNRFLRCFSRRYDEVEVLEGEIEFSFHIDVRGGVTWVYPSRSTIGDRATERCLLSTAASTHFPRPHGGEAEFSYPIEVGALDDVRPAVPWQPTQVSEAVEEHRGEIVDCGSGPFAITVYVGPGGSVLSAGVATSDPEQNDALDCVAELVEGWTFPDPGSYPAKVSFDL